MERVHIYEFNWRAAIHRVSFRKGLKGFEKYFVDLTSVLKIKYIDLVKIYIKYV